MTIRERIRHIQAAVLSDGATPEIVREADMTLSALLGNVHQEQRIADQEYKLVLLGCLQGAEAANRARIRAEVTPQYMRAREAKDVAEELKQLSISCRGYLRSLNEELRLAK